MTNTLPSTNLWLTGEIQFKNKNTLNCGATSFKRCRQSYLQTKVSNILYMPPSDISILYRELHATIYIL